MLNKKAPREARRKTDWGFIWAGVKGVIYGLLLGKTLSFILKLILAKTGN